MDCEKINLWTLKDSLTNSCELVSEENKFMGEVENLKKEIEIIKQRNRKVEADKAWETSVFRVASIVAMTYIVTAIVFYFIGVKNFILNALIPTVGFYLSTQSLPFIKKWWVEKFYR